MKGEYLDPHQQHHHHHHHLQPKHEAPPPPSSAAMFSKLQPHPHHHPHLPFSPHFQLSRESEEDDTRSTGAAATASTPPPSKQHQHSNKRNEPTVSSGGTDGATIEIVRRPRGRPPGSKNRPKPPVIITRETGSAMSPYILEVPGGNDVVEAIARFCRRKNLGICVLTGSGTVANVTLRQPSTTSGTVTFHGRFDILSISATFLPQSPSCPVPNNFTISLAGPQCQIVGGLVAGSLVAAGTVFVIAASFNNPSYHRLPSEEEASRNSGSGEGGSPAVSGAGGAESGGNAQGEGSGGEGMGMYSCHMPSDVIWAPTARAPPPPPPY